jgi:hypothetical protein
MDTPMPSHDDPHLHSIVQQVISEAHINPELILPVEIGMALAAGGYVAL